MIGGIIYQKMPWCRQHFRIWCHIQLQHQNVLWHDALMREEQAVEKPVKRTLLEASKQSGEKCESWGSAFRPPSVANRQYLFMFSTFAPFISLPFEQDEIAYSHPGRLIVTSFFTLSA